VLARQIDLICAAQLMSIEVTLAVHIGGDARLAGAERRSRSVRRNADPAAPDRRLCAPETWPDWAGIRTQLPIRRSRRNQAGSASRTDQPVLCGSSSAVLPS
jgi:hypothetical protein